MVLKSISFITTSLVLMAMMSGEALSDEVNPAAEVVSVQGDGQYRTEDRDPWKIASVKQDLFAGNFVRTGDYSRMGLLFSDRTQIRLNEKTLIQLKEVQDPSSGKKSTLLRLNLGRTWSQSKSIPDGLIMETPSATAAIRGTQWELSVDENGNSTLTVLRGEVEFYNDFGRLLVVANEQARAEVGRAPVKTLLVDPQERVQWVTAYEVNPVGLRGVFDNVTSRLF